MRYHTASQKRTKRDVKSRVEGRTVVGQRLEYPSGVAVDFHTGRLFWADAKKSVVESSDSDGADRILVRDFGKEKPYKIVVCGDWIFGTTFLTNKVFRVRKYANLAGPLAENAYMASKDRDIGKIDWILDSASTRPALTVLRSVGSEILGEFAKAARDGCGKCAGTQLCLAAGTGRYDCVDECQCEAGLICKKTSRSGVAHCEPMEVGVFCGG